MMRGVFCFRNDLRLHDNAALEHALRECDQLFLVYAFEDRYWLAKNPTRISIHRTKFILQSLECLQRQISGLGGILHFIHGNLEDALPKFMEEMGAECCFLSEENAFEEKSTERKLTQIVPVRLEYSRTLIHLNDLPFDLENLPETFSKFRKLVEKNWFIRSCIESPVQLFSDSNPSSTIPNLNNFGYQNKSKLGSMDYYLFRGGVSAGQYRLKEWIWEKRCISVYKKTRSYLSGSDFSSRFSPWLSNGCLSPREIYWEIKDYETKHGANESTYWLVFELLWRDFFHFFARLHGSRIFQPQGIHPERKSLTEPPNAEELFKDWKMGTTVNSFINANMNELRMTGWMSNRGRQNVASFLINDLGLEWRRGAQWFEEQLIDYDPCSNYGNWLYLSGFGNDPREKRYFNIKKQSDHYDPEGNYTREWTSSTLPIPD